MLPGLDKKLHHIRRLSAQTPAANCPTNRKSRISYLKLSTPVSRTSPSSPTFENTAKPFKDYDIKFQECPTPQDMLKSIKSSFAENKRFLNPSIERNLEKMNFSHQPQADANPPYKYEKEYRPPPQIEVRHSDYVEKFYHSPESATLQNKISFPGDWDFDVKKILKQSESIAFAKALGNKIAAKNNPEEANAPDEFLNLLLRETETQQTIEKDEHPEITKFFWYKNIYAGPPSREGGSLVKIKGKYYLFGGQNRIKHSDIRVFDPLKWTWSILETEYSPKGRIGHSAVGYKGKMIVFGGWSQYSARLGIRRCVKKLFVYSIKSNKWQHYIGAGLLPSARRHQASSRIGKTMIMFGGISQESKVLSSLYTLDIKDQRWTKHNISGAKPCGRSHSTLTSVYPSAIMEMFNFDLFSIPIQVGSSNGFYLFGGNSMRGEAKNDLWILRPVDGYLVWKELKPKGNTPSARFDHTTVYVNHRLIIYGGRNDALLNFEKNSPCKDIGILKIETLEWENVFISGDQPNFRWGHNAGVIGSKMIILGGLDYYQFMNSDMLLLETDQIIAKERIKAYEEQPRPKEETKINFKKYITELTSKFGLAEM
ncbi:unnamed protein product [Blepharisma stoltei]|uniref:Kelch repeat-containing protein n=1 Tax=Blepharisma stoltei TaxID=1481888 RepID=A0AAU9INR3_9CILI|nr:unnamed protein product [Blepharisma stoltei]